MEKIDTAAAANCVSLILWIFCTQNGRFHKKHHVYYYQYAPDWRDSMHNWRRPIYKVKCLFLKCHMTKYKNVQKLERQIMFYNKA